MNNMLGAILIFAFISVYVGNALANESMKLIENDAGKIVEMLIGGQLEVELPGNPTTGYVWEVSSLDSNVLRFVKADFIANDKAIGSGGMDHLKFQAIAEGMGVLRLKFHKPFERNISPLKTFEVTVRIKK